MGVPAFPRRKSIRQQKEGKTTQESTRDVHEVSTARMVEENDAMPPTNDRRDEGLNWKERMESAGKWYH
jgi:hypothetical protein